MKELVGMRRNIIYEGICLQAMAVYTEALHARKCLDSASWWEVDIYLFVYLFVWLFIYFSLAGFNKAIKLHLLTFFTNPERWITLRKWKNEIAWVRFYPHINILSIILSLFNIILKFSYQLPNKYTFVDTSSIQWDFSHYHKGKEQ